MKIVASFSAMSRWYFIFHSALQPPISRVVKLSFLSGSSLLLTLFVALLSGEGGILYACNQGQLIFSLGRDYVFRHVYIVFPPSFIARLPPSHYYYQHHQVMFRAYSFLAIFASNPHLHNGQISQLIVCCLIKRCLSYRPAVRRNKDL